MWNKGWETAASAFRNSESPSPTLSLNMHKQSMLGMRGREAFASLKARSMFKKKKKPKQTNYPIRQFGSATISAHLCSRWC